MAGKKKTKSLDSPRASAEVGAPPSALQDTTMFASRVGEEGKKKSRITMSNRAGIQISCSRVMNHLRRGNYAKHIQRGKIFKALVFLG